VLLNQQIHKHNQESVIATNMQDQLGKIFPKQTMNKAQMDFRFYLQLRNPLSSM
jgi:hypothetical protein